MIEMLETFSPTTVVVVVGILGLLFGSFLNVVIYRLPKSLDQEQDASIAEYLEQKKTKGESLGFLPFGIKCTKCQQTSGLDESLALLSEEDRLSKAPAFNLATPASACLKCQHEIRWYENIPVLSWLFLRGKCSSCKTPISLRYPFVELLTGVLFGLVAWRFGASIATPLWCFFVFMCIAIAGIDWDTTWLPDSLSLSLMWVGIIAAVLGWTIPVTHSIWGAVAGYMILWLIVSGFRFATGKIGMANGDFKMLAALGAWFGWNFLLPIILISSVIGLVGYVIIKLLQSKAGLFEGKYMPFGPYLAATGLSLLFITPDVFSNWFPSLVLSI